MSAAVAGLCYLVVAAAMTWPLVLHLDTHIYGAGGDAWAGLAMWREQVGHNPFLPGRLGDFAAPDGLTVPYSLNLATWPSTLALWSLSSVVGEVAAVGAFTLSAYVLSGVAMFLLALRLTGRRDVAFVAGLAFAFTPYATAKGAGHWHFAHGWPLVLAAWRMLVLVERPSWRSGVVTGLLVGFAASFTPYYVLFVAMIVGTFLVVGAVLALRDRRLRAFLLAAAAVLGVFAAMIGGYAAVAATDENAPLRTDATALPIWSGKPLQYVTPTEGNVIVGEWARDVRAARGDLGGEASVYVGVSVLLLALVGLVALVRRVRRREAPPELLAFPLLVITAARFSTPATIELAGTEVKTVVGHVYDVTPAFRIFIRSFQVAMVGLVVLAALGLAALRRAPGRTRTALVAVAAAVVFLDLSPVPFRATAVPVPRPAVYDALAKLPRGIVAEYPMDAGTVPSYEPILHQELHGHPMVNGYAVDSIEERRALQLADLFDPGTVPGLATLGVRYVVVRDGITMGGRPWTGTERVAGLEPVAAGDGRRVFRVRATPRPVLWTWSRAVTGAESVPPVEWLSADRATLDVRAACARCRARIVVGLATWGRPRRVTLRGGTVSATVDVPVGENPQLVLDVPYFERGMRAVLEASPEPQVTSDEDARLRGVGLVSSQVEVAAAG